MLPRCKGWVEVKVVLAAPGDRRRGGWSGRRLYGGTHPPILVQNTLYRTRNDAVDVYLLLFAGFSNRPPFIEAPLS